MNLHCAPRVCSWPAHIVLREAALRFEFGKFDLFLRCFKFGVSHPSPHATAGTTNGGAGCHEQHCFHPVDHVVLLRFVEGRRTVTKTCDGIALD